MGCQTYLVHSSAGRYKIGMSRNPFRRLCQLIAERPLERLTLVALFDGNIERELHVLFRDYRESGEWFRADDSIPKEFRRRGASQHALRLRGPRRPEPKPIIRHRRRKESTAPDPSIAVDLMMASDLIGAGWTRTSFGEWRSPSGLNLKSIEQAWKARHL